MDTLKHKYIITFWEAGEYKRIKFKKFKKANKFFTKKSNKIQGVCMDEIITKLLKCN